MKELLNFINNNAIVASLITLAITTIIQILFRKSDRRYNEKQDSKKEKRKQFENKAELNIENNIDDDDGLIPRISLFMTDFNAKVVNNKKDVEFYYSKDIGDKNKYKHLIFYIKNIGNVDINELYICATSQKNTMLCDVNEVEFISKNKIVNYSFIYDRKIMKQKAIMIDIAYLEDSKICNMFSSELALIFKDSYGNLYEQPFFIQQKNLYEPYPITYKDFKIYTQTDTAIECFKNPWMW